MINNMSFISNTDFLRLYDKLVKYKLRCLILNVFNKPIKVLTDCSFDMRKLKALVLALAFNLSNGHNAYWTTPNHLHPVHGLYIKPSTDGTTGDLFVAATEENGVKAQWLTDHPVNFLPTAAAQNGGLPIPYLSGLPTALPHDDHQAAATTQKRAVITSPAIKYTYALPVPGSSEGSAVPYPYTLPSAPVTTATSSKSSTECSENPTTAVAYPHYPSFYYSQMMAAFAHAMNSALKETETTDEAGTSTKQAVPSAAMWPYTYGYGYPVQYVMVDPKSWTENQTAAAAALQPTTTASPEPASEETP